MANYPVWVRTVPFIGTMVVSAYAVAYTWYYTLEKKRLQSHSHNLDEAYVLEFYKKISETTGKTEWKNKRVKRPWGE
ncbi:unnamed protein product [Schistosoma turkestanicum]|nr:unnamed protein product [Schistosoma turkestanicum]